MSCDNPAIPTYLHYDNKIHYEDSHFKHFHKYYRLKSEGNPIEIPPAWVTAISGKWSWLIRKKHITQIDDNSKWNDYDFVFIKELRNFKLIEYNEDQEDDYRGRHLLSCTLNHDPKECDYSHCEILIKHEVYNPEDSLIFNQIYSYKDWREETALLKMKKSKFYKNLKKAFRVKMIQLISRDSYRNNWFFDLSYRFSS